MEPKRKRLSRKQLAFLRGVFESGRTVDDMTRSLGIRPRTLDRWFADPLFADEFSMRISHLYLEARTQLARGVADSIIGLTRVSHQTRDLGLMRQCSLDMLTTHTQLVKLGRTFNKTKKTRNTMVPNGDRINSLLDKFASFLAKDGAVLETFCVSKPPEPLSAPALSDAEGLLDAPDHR